VTERMPKIGDYWCMGLLTEDFFEAVKHAVKYAKEHRTTVKVDRYVDIEGSMPYLVEVVVIAGPTMWS